MLKLNERLIVSGDCHLSALYCYAPETAKNMLELLKSSNKVQCKKIVQLQELTQGSKEKSIDFTQPFELPTSSRRYLLVSIDDKRTWFKIKFWETQQQIDL